MGADISLRCHWRLSHASLVHRRRTPSAWTVPGPNPGDCPKRVPERVDCTRPNQTQTRHETPRIQPLRVQSTRSPAAPLGQSPSPGDCPKRVLSTEGGARAPGRYPSQPRGLSQASPRARGLYPAQPRGLSQASPRARGLYPAPTKPRQDTKHHGYNLYGYSPRGRLRPPWDSPQAPATVPRESCPPKEDPERLDCPRPNPGDCPKRVPERVDCTRPQLNPDKTRNTTDTTFTGTVHAVACGALGTVPKPRRLSHASLVRRRRTPSAWTVPVPKR